MRRAYSLFELLAAVAILSVLVTGLATVFMGLNSAQSFALTMPQVQNDAQQMTLKIAAAVRKASLCTSTDSGCTLNAGVESASSTSLTIYTHDSSGTLVKTTYANSGGNVTTSTNGGTPSTLYSNASISFAYYQSSTYHASSLTSFTPDSTTSPQLIGVQITGTVTSGSLTASYSTIVRLRNGPLKVQPTD